MSTTSHIYHKGEIVFYEETNDHTFHLVIGVTNDQHVELTKEELLEMALAIQEYFK